MEIYNQLLLVVLGAVVGLIGSYLLSHFGLSESDVEEVKNQTAVFVRAAEQAFEAGDNEAKFEFVKKAALDYARSRGINIPESVVDALIEYCVNAFTK